MYNIEISIQANEDLNDLFMWIAYEKDSPKTAFKYLQGIYDKIKSLEQNPTKYALRTNKGYGENVRRFNYKSHAVLYSVDENTMCVSVIRVVSQNSIVY